MPNSVTAIAARPDRDGNFRLEVTAEDGAVTEAQMDPKMATEVRLTIQEQQVRLFAGMLGPMGNVVLDVAKCEAGANAAGDRILLVESKQYGVFGLRVSTEQATEMARCLYTLVHGSGGAAH